MGSRWDGKESIFRNYGGILGVHDDVGVALYLSQGHLVHVDIKWITPVGSVASVHDLKLEPMSTVTMHKLEVPRPLMPGRWTVQVAIKGGDMIIEETFMVTPLMFNNRQPLENPVEVNAKYSSDLQTGMDTQLYMEWKTNVAKSGKKLEDWIDALVGEFWSVVNVCRSDDSSGCGSLAYCDRTNWSALSPDPKSELGRIQPNGHIR